MRHDKESLGGEGQKSRIAASREDWDFRWRLGANPPPSPNKHSLFVFLPTLRRSLFVSPPDGCRSSISLHSDNLRNSSCSHFRPPSPEAGWRRERGPGGPGGAEAVDAARAEPTSAAFSRERPSGRGGEPHAPSRRDARLPGHPVPARTAGAAEPRPLWGKSRHAEPEAGWGAQGAVPPPTWRGRRRGRSGDRAPVPATGSRLVLSRRRRRRHRHT